MSIDRQAIIEAAQVVLKDAGYPCQVAAVFGQQDSDLWCVDFTNGYRRLCHTFHDESGGELDEEGMKALLAGWLERARREKGVKR